MMSSLILRSFRKRFQTNRQPTDQNRREIKKDSYQYNDRHLGEKFTPGRLIKGYCQNIEKISQQEASGQNTEFPLFLFNCKDCIFHCLYFFSFN